MKRSNTLAALKEGKQNNEKKQKNGNEAALPK